MNTWNGSQFSHKVELPFEQDTVQATVYSTTTTARPVLLFVLYYSIRQIVFRSAAL